MRRKKEVYGAKYWIYVNVNMWRHSHIFNIIYYIYISIEDYFLRADIWDLTLSLSLWKSKLYLLRISPNILNLLNFVKSNENTVFYHKLSNHLCIIESNSHAVHRFFHSNNWHLPLLELMLQTILHFHLPILPIQFAFMQV